MIRHAIAWCLLAPLLCLFAAGVVLVAVTGVALLLIVWCALNILHWSERKR